LADLRLFLFSEAIHPALVVSYRSIPGDVKRGKIEYLAPKADWATTQAELIIVGSADRRSIRVDELLSDLDGEDAPQLWSQNFWGSPRDLRFIDRMLLHPRLRDLVRLPSEHPSSKRWVRAEGFQPAGESDDATRAKRLKLPSRYFIKATHPNIDLFVLPEDTEELPEPEVVVRNRSNSNTDIFRAPHVLITKGFQRIAYADFDVSFRHAIRGIHGPEQDRSLLIFLAAYLRTPLAKYLMFHTSSNWGIYRPEVHVQEILRLPMLLPELHRDTTRAAGIVEEVARVVEEAGRASSANFLSRKAVVTAATQAIEPLVNEYFDVQPSEQLLIDDTINIIVPSVQPTRSRISVPTMTPATDKALEIYKERLCATLAQWSRASADIAGRMVRSEKLGIAMAIIDRTNRRLSVHMNDVDDIDVLAAVDALQKSFPSTKKSMDFVRGLKIFHGSSLYIVKPDTMRHWTQSCALNDADEIAGTLLAYPSEVSA
jgi:hypothetical protein